MPARALACFILVASLLFASSATADIPPPDVEKCAGKKVGDPCDGGVCQDSTCTRATPDGTREYACVRCVPKSDEKEAPKKSGACAGGSTADLPLGVGLGLLAFVAIRRRAMRHSRV